MFPGRALRDLRIAAGLTLEEVAHSAGVSTAYLSKVERDEKAPRARWVSRVLFAIGNQLGTAERTVAKVPVVEQVPA